MPLNSGTTKEENGIFGGGGIGVNTPVWETARMKQIPFVGIRRVMELATKLEAEGKKVVHFEIGRPDFDTPENIKKAAADALFRGVVHYTSNFGLPELRKAIATKLEKYNGLKVDPEKEIIVTVGGEEAVAAVVTALIDPGDEVLVSDPGYTPYSNLVRLASGVPVLVPLLEEHGFDYDYEALEKAVTRKTRMIIVNWPHNPTGATLPKERLLKLAEFCEAHNLIVLSDEAYDQILYDGASHISFATLLGMAKRTVTVGSLSKTYSMTGWRIGYIAASAAAVKSIVRVHQNLVLCAASFAQAGAIEALRGPQESVRAMVAQFDCRRQLLWQGLRQLGIPCHRPQGAFYLFPNFSELGIDCQRLSEILLQDYGVAVVPGDEFGPRGAGHVRISYATSYNDCEEGLRRITAAVEAIRSGKYSTR